MGEMADSQYASNAKGNTGVALGATGLGLAVANILGNNGSGIGGLVGGLFGNNQNRAVSAAELQYVSNLQAENAMFKSENYADKVGKDVYGQSLVDNRMLRTEMYSAVTPLIAETHAKAVADAEKIARLEEQIKCCCEKSVLQDKILDQKIDSQTNLLTGKINETALALNGKIDTNMATLNGKINTDMAVLNGQMNTMQAINTGKFDVLDQTIACIKGDVCGLTYRLNNITTEIVPSCKVCPEPMPRYNSFTAPTEKEAAA